MPKGKPYPAEFKARLVPEAPQGAKTVGEIAAEHGLNPNLVRNWKAKAESDLSRVFSAAEDERAREGRRVRDAGRAPQAHRGLRRAAQRRPPAPVARQQHAVRVVLFGLAAA